MSNPYYDREGDPIDLETFRILQGDHDYARVALTGLKDGDHHAAVVSTVWIGLDYAYVLGLDGARQIFETLVMTADQTIPDKMIRRYSNISAARAGHLAVVALVADTMNGPVVVKEQGMLG